MQKTRPKHLALWQIRLPLPGIVSILHRISGILMFAAIPFMLYALEGSLGSAERFAAFKDCIGNPLVKLFLLAVLWAYLHHACAGIRFLFLDIHKGLDLKTARLTAYVVLAVSLTLTAIIGAITW
ncbi:MULTISPECIES: succinate dehydrogenase, cytochrome b556 subunit [Deefgea]|uniref:Succinate dehydrogenase cytochrome b556 subunit n=1 Tax=Deefgea chitinilytica TaxID=570276 RepID=A0ABS2CAC2_9NEIS|nr:MULTISPECIES: succinate dehydrogenase, cytochrome b556 subunit [Deefgea]MBM5570625.1 succinate dehydrogenase, cytochrome b556 subunit [Deefgea chitinilytica]MBM9887854.1 succinate dehydrogenase, cytochrome b556 subunit [Deefgea sp. CFH1-16]